MQKFDAGSQKNSTPQSQCDGTCCAWRLHRAVRRFVHGHFAWDGCYLGPLLPSFFLISGLSYKTTFNRELRISNFPLYSI